MEKRLFLAIFLSFVVLFGWSLLFPEQQLKDSPLESIEQTKAEEFSDQDDDDLSQQLISSKSIPSDQKSTVNQEEISTIETDELILKFSNIGGSLDSVYLSKYSADLPVRNVGSIVGFSNEVFKLIRLDKSSEKTSIAYELDDENVKVVKIYEVVNGEYYVQSEIEIFDKTNKSKSIDLEINELTLDMSNLENGDGGLFGGADITRDLMFYEYAISQGKDIRRKNSAYKFTKKEDRSVAGAINWIGMRDRFFCLLVRPQIDTSGYSVKVLSEKKLSLFTAYNNLTYDRSGSVQLNNDIYVGPQEPKLMSKLGAGAERLVSFNIGNFFDIFAFGLGDPAAKLLLGIMSFVHGIVKSWGISIIFVALLVCGATYPLTMNSMKSMKKMQLVQPEAMKIREKHKDNPQKLNKETMELYKKHGVNPLGGCLPMLVQMPVFFGVIQLLWRYVGLKGQSFGWIKDLSEPDRLFVMPISLPIIGSDINILPWIVFVLSIFQQKFSSKNMVTTDPNVAAQQKIMKFMFPAMIILFFYKFASSVGLYFTIFYVYQTFIQWKISRQKTANLTSSTQKTS